MALANVRQYAEFADLNRAVVDEQSLVAQSQLDSAGTDEVNLNAKTRYVIVQAADAAVYFDLYQATGGAPSATGANGEIRSAQGARIGFAVSRGSSNWVAIAAASD